MYTEVSATKSSCIGNNIKKFSFTYQNSRSFVYEGSFKLFLSYFSHLFASILSQNSINDGRCWSRVVLQ